MLINTTTLLLTKAKQGDKISLAQLWKNFQPKLNKLLSKYSFPTLQQEGGDMINDAYIAFHKAILNLDLNKLRSSFYSYVSRPVLIAIAKAFAFARNTTGIHWGDDPKTRCILRNLKMELKTGREGEPIGTHKKLTGVTSYKGKSFNPIRAWDINLLWFVYLGQEMKSKCGNFVPATVSLDSLAGEQLANAQVSRDSGYDFKVGKPNPNFV